MNKSFCTIVIWMLREPDSDCPEIAMWKKTKTIVCIMVELLSAPDINEEANGQANLYSVLYVLV